ncbi:CHAT domain-containing protein [Halomonas sp. TRM85114]|uniref:DUF7363 domain-containing protein n=1 Tax=Halomonas jincaotanensis TaxID=2810616 RepID=UPI001BD46741|nr:CHAT domain-containing protein [Halomonas jincaotanensis]MBS9405456.1 CHAT domain-containing protein [Halomonas jincaotanensis]
MIDLYTNLVVGTSRVLSFLGPKGDAAGGVLRAALRGLAQFAKAITVAGLDSGRVPGLAAMDSSQPFVRELNRTQPGQPTPSDLDVFAITSDFDSAGPFHKLSGLPSRLKKALADRLVDQLMGTKNDLVVNVNSMTWFDPEFHHPKGFIRDIHNFGTKPRVYHTNYFLQPETFIALRRWLGVGLPFARDDRGVTRSEPGLIVEDLPSVADPDFVAVDAAMPAAEARALVDASTNRFVVVRRFEPSERKVYHYGFTRGEFDEILTAVDPEGIVNGLGILHETEASPEIGSGRLQDFSTAEASTPWGRREIALSGGWPVGVIPHASEVSMKGAEPHDEASSSVMVEYAYTQPMSRRQRRLLMRRAERFVERQRLGSNDYNAAYRKTYGNKGETSASPATESKTLRQFFRAQMDGEIVIDQPVTLMVELSAEELPMAAGRTEAGSGANVNPSRKISLAVLGRKNVVVDGDSRVDIDPAAPGAPHRLFFNVRGTDEGDGEVWVIAQQGPQPLVTLELHPVVVPARSGARRRDTVSDAVVPLVSQTRPRNQLRIVEQRHGDRTSFDFEFRSEKLDCLEFDKTPLDMDPAEYVADLYRDIESRWVSSQSDVEAFALDLQAMGVQMFTRLIPLSIQHALWKGRDTIESIEVVSTEPFIPWELVHLKDPDGLGLDGRERFFGLMGLVRWLHGAGLPRPQIRLKDATVKAVVPDYPAGSGMELPATMNELAFVQQRLGGEQVPAQHADLIRLLRTPGSFDVLHFAGHGVAAADNIANSQLILEGRVENGAWIPSELSATTVEAFANLAGHDGSRPLVFLNACQVGRAGYQLNGLGGFAQAFLRKRAGTFVSSLWAVGDAPAATFTRVFYEALLDEKTLAQATTAARRAARTAGKPPGSPTRCTVTHMQSRCSAGNGVHVIGWSSHRETAFILEGAVRPHIMGDANSHRPGARIALASTAVKLDLCPWRHPEAIDESLRLPNQVSTPMSRDFRTLR